MVILTIFATIIVYSYHGDKMKTYLKIILGAVVIGGVFAYFFYKDINASVRAITNKENNLSIFQVGVFKSEENAINYQSNLPNSIIYQDDSGYYRVIVGVAYHEENKVKLEGYFSNKGIEYYIKEIKVSDEFIEKLSNYETVIIKSDKEEVIDNINVAMLKLFLTYLK